MTVSNSYKIKIGNVSSGNFPLYILALISCTKLIETCLCCQIYVVLLFHFVGRMSQDGSDEDVAFEVESDESEVVVDVEKNLGPDFKYSGQFGYWFYKVLRGNTPGRHLKRDVFYFTVIQIVCSAVLLKTINDASYLLITSKFLHQTVALNNFRVS